MHLQHPLSGIIVSLVITGIGFTSGLECINCLWDASAPGSANSSVLCLSDAHNEPNMTCPEKGNLLPICETMLEFHVVGKLKTLKKLNRKCAFDHPNCNKPCIPEKDPVCYQCCSRHQTCNTLPLSLKLMEPASPASSIHVIKATWYLYVLLALTSGIGKLLINSVV